MANALLLELQLATLLGEPAGRAAASNTKVTKSAALNVVTRAYISTVPHMKQASNARKSSETVKQCVRAAGFTTVRVRCAAGVEVLIASSIAAICYAGTPKG